MIKQIIDLIVAAVLAVIAIGAFFHLGFSILNSGEERLAHTNASAELLLENWRREFKDNNGIARMDKIWPGDTWDTVCIIQIYYYVIDAVTEQELEKYFGKNFRNHLDPIPNPYAIHYGIGFSFLKNGELSEFIEIPAVKTGPGAESHYARHSATKIHFDMNGKQQTLDFDEMGVRFDNPDDNCLSRSSSYIEFKSSYQIYARED